MSTGYHLPDHAPSRTVRPGDNPSPTMARALLAEEGVDATNLDTVACYIRESG